jgi:hypothetical protein
MYVSFAVVLVGMSLYLARPAPLIYFETRGINNEFPVLIIGFRDGHAIVYRMTFPEEMSLLAGDGTVVPGESIEVPIMDDLAKLTGEFAIDVDRVWETLRRFMTTGSTADLGTWTEL